MILSIHQPSYWPWLGLLDKIAKTDTFVLLDDVQVVKGSYQYRNLFFCNGESKFITLPLNLKLGMNFIDLTFRNDNWRADHLNKYYNYYLKTPFFEQVFSDLEMFYNQEFLSPLQLLKESMLFCFQKLNMNVKMLLSSTYSVEGNKGDKVLNLCKAVCTDEYLAGRGSYNYMQEYLHRFEQEHIIVKWHSFRHPVYEQSPKFTFVEGLGCLDIFFFQGFENSRKIFWNNIQYGE